MRHAIHVVIIATVATGAGSTGAQSAKPTITSFSPEKITVTDTTPGTVTVKGSFVGITSAFVNNTSVKFKLVGDTSTLELAITWATPSGLIRVYTAGGSAISLSPLTVTYANAPTAPGVKPTIASMNTTVAAIGDTVYLTGTSLGSVGSAKVGTMPAKFAYDNITQRLGVTVPTGATSGSFITIKDQSGTYEVSAPTAITIKAPTAPIPAGCPKALPTLTSVGYTVSQYGGAFRVLGGNIECANDIKIGTTSVKSFKKISCPTGTCYDVVTPAIAAGKYNLSVTTPAGTGTSAGPLVKVTPY